MSCESLTFVYIWKQTGCFISCAVTGCECTADNECPCRFVFLHWYCSVITMHGPVNKILAPNFLRWVVSYQVENPGDSFCHDAARKLYYISGNGIHK